MKIGILGGTGRMGKGLALRWTKSHDIVIGSRSLDKALNTAKELTEVAKGFYQNEMTGSIIGGLNSTAITKSDIVIITLPPMVTFSILSKFISLFNAKQIVVSTVVPMEKKGSTYVYTPLSVKDILGGKEKSAAELIYEIVKPTQVATAFHTIPAAYLNNLDAVLNIDVFISSSSDSATNKIAKLICEIPNFRPLRIGPLQNSRLIESITPLLLNTAILNNLKDPSIRVVPWIPSSYETCEQWSQ